jgi:hypothetical protein
MGGVTPRRMFGHPRRRLAAIEPVFNERDEAGSHPVLDGRDVAAMEPALTGGTSQHLSTHGTPAQQPQWIRLQWAGRPPDRHVSTGQQPAAMEPAPSGPDESSGRGGCR